MPLELTGFRVEVRNGGSSGLLKMSLASDADAINAGVCTHPVFCTSEHVSLFAHELESLDLSGERFIEVLIQAIGRAAVAAAYDAGFDAGVKEQRGETRAI